jgi:hypothetical protein
VPPPTRPGLHLAALERANTATASSPESADSRSHPSPVTLTWVGVGPFPCGRISESIPWTRIRLVLITAITSSLALATNASGAAGSTAMPSESARCGPTGSVFTTLAVAKLITDTVAWVSLVTSPVDPVGRPDDAGATRDHGLGPGGAQRDHGRDRYAPHCLRLVPDVI